MLIIIIRDVRTITDTAISTAQRTKNTFGKAHIIGSVCGLKSQFVFPGKKILWKAVKADLKSRETMATKAKIVTMRYKPEVKVMSIP